MKRFLLLTMAASNEIQCVPQVEQRCTKNPHPLCCSTGKASCLFVTAEAKVLHSYCERQVVLGDCRSIHEHLVIDRHRHPPQSIRWPPITQLALEDDDKHCNFYFIGVWLSLNDGSSCCRPVTTEIALICDCWHH